MKKEIITHIVVACCTYQRPKMLHDSLMSLSEVEFPKDILVEVLVVDNDENQSAKSIIENIQPAFSCKINYCNEPKRGLAKVRNRLVAEAVKMGASHIALFDDDELLDKNWLKNHVDFYNKNAEVLISSGPSFAKFLKKSPKYIEKNNIFVTSTSKATGTKRKACASGNVFFPASILTKQDIHFDEKYNFMGGEDGDYFFRASNSGYTIMWNNEAVAYEMIDASRANLMWILKRYYFHGYKSTYLRSEHSKNKILNTLYTAKLLLVLTIDAALLLPSLIFGLTGLFNMLGMFIKTYGKVMGMLISKRPDYYVKITGC